MPTLRSSVACRRRRGLPARPASRAPRRVTTLPHRRPPRPHRRASSRRCAPPTGRPCLPEGAAAVTTGPEDDPTLVAFAGSGTRGVVLAPQSDGQVCQWARELVRLVEEGYLVATFSWSGRRRALLHRRGRRAARGRRHGGRVRGCVEGRHVRRRPRRRARPGHRRRARPARGVRRPRRTLDVRAATPDRCSSSPRRTTAASPRCRRSWSHARTTRPRSSSSAAARTVSSCFNGEHRAQVEQLIDDALASGFGG